MKRRKILDLSEIYNGENLLINDFTNLDLSDIDLSCIPMTMWENCIFYNTNFHNTGIKFIPCKLKQTSNRYWGIGMHYCDFSNNDLSFLTLEDFGYKEGVPFVNTMGCNFRSTGVRCLTTFLNLSLDESYGDLPFEFWDKNHRHNPSNYCEIDILTVAKNPFLKISSRALLEVIFGYTQRLWKKCIRGVKDLETTYFDEEYTAKVIGYCELFLKKYDKQGYARDLYDRVSKNLTLENKWFFFRNEFRNVDFKDVDLTGIPFSILSEFYFHRCKFDNVTIDCSISDLLTIRPEHFYDVGNYSRNEYKDFRLSSITASSWKDRSAQKKRISDSAITFYTKVYLELTRTCNARCAFCRNLSFDKSNYDLERIKQTLIKIKQHINAVVIGGGEPTLRIEDVLYLRDFFEDADIDWHMFTNGTNKAIIEDDRLMSRFKINLSRHAINDEENASIFRVNPSNIMTTKDIERLNQRNGEVTINATCFKGGLDNARKIIDFIDYARTIGCKKVLVQDLQKNSSLGKHSSNCNEMYIDSNVFEQVIDYLMGHGFRKRRYPIIASGGYVTQILKAKDDFMVSFQNYLTLEEIESKWPTAIKRAFDLSIAPSGELYENWHQKSGIVSIGSNPNS